MAQLDTAQQAQSEQILILDFGSQYAQLIARRVREHRVFCRLVRHDLTAASAQGNHFKRRPFQRLRQGSTQVRPRHS